MSRQKAAATARGRERRGPERRIQAAMRLENTDTRARRTMNVALLLSALSVARTARADGACDVTVMQAGVLEPAWRAALDALREELATRSDCAPGW